MTLAIILSAVAMTVIVGVRYLLVSGAFAWITVRKHPGLYLGLDPQVRREIIWSLASAALYGIPAGVVAWGWQHHGWSQVYSDIHAYPLCTCRFLSSCICCCTMPGSTGRTAGCTGPNRSGWRTPSTTPANHRPPGRLWRFTRSRR